MTSMLAPSHQRLLDGIQHNLSADSRFAGLLAGGSLIHGGVDEFSDLDLVLVASDGAYDAVMKERRAIAEIFGDLLAAFTGEHVGEPRLLICLYGPDLVHVDLKFVAADALTHLPGPVAPVRLLPRPGGRCVAPGRPAGRAERRCRAAAPGR